MNIFYWKSTLLNDSWRKSGFLEKLGDVSSIKMNQKLKFCLQNVHKFYRVKMLSCVLKIIIINVTANLKYELYPAILLSTNKTVVNRL